MNPALTELLWNFVASITPSGIISAFDSGSEKALSEDPLDDLPDFESRSPESKSNAMKRIMGLDGAGIMTAVQRTRTLPSIGSVFNAEPSNSLPGLGNWDNSCYQNSVLQGLAALEFLPAFLGQTTAGDPQPTMTALREMIERLNDPANVGKTLWPPAELKSMSSWQQQDAQEYFSKISDKLEKDTAKAVHRKTRNAGLASLTLMEQDVTNMNSSVTRSGSTNSNNATSNPLSIEQLPKELVSLIVRNPLEGLLAQRVGCQQCGYVEGLSLVPFNCLTVPLGKHWMYDIRSCLDEYTALELISGVECAKCTLQRTKQQMEQLICQFDLRSSGSDMVSDDSSQALRVSLGNRLKTISTALEDEDFSDQVLKKCQIPSSQRVSTTKSRQAVIARSPKSLAIHVNRSNFDELTGIQSKNSASVKFPQHLDLAPWCLGHGPNPTSDDAFIENWDVDPSKSMLSTDENIGNLGSGRIYVLRAVITHYGRHENGHYICYRKSPYAVKLQNRADETSTEPWWRLSDEEVTEVDTDTTLAQGGVFMLFYEQVECLPRENEQQSNVPEHHKEQLASIGHDEALDPMGEAISPLLQVAAYSQQINAEPEDQSIASAQSTPLDLTPKFIEDISKEVKEVKEAEKRDPENIPDTDPSGSRSATSSTPLESLPTMKAQAAPETKPGVPSSAPQPSTPARSMSSQSKESEIKKVELVVSVPPTKETQGVSPASMRTAGPRTGRSSVSRAGKVMGSVPGFVQAN